MATNGQREGTDLVIEYLHEAHATETALITTLRAHSSIAPRGTYRTLLERHLRETQEQAEAIQRRLAELGASSNIVQTGAGLLQTVVGQVLALSKGPIDLLRGSSREEKLLKNAKDESASEALEIATYDGLETLATAVGDGETAELARRHRAQEERMLEALREQIPALAEATARSRAPEAVSAAAASGSAKRPPSRGSSPRTSSSRGSTTRRTGSRSTTASRARSAT